MPAAVVKQVEQSDSYRDVAVVALRLPASADKPAPQVADFIRKSGLSSAAPKSSDASKAKAGETIDLTGRMDKDGRLQWDAPAGRWLVLRFGQASNFKMTRPCPRAAVGLECDRLSTDGIDAHFNAFFKKVIEDAGAAAGGTLAFAHIDSWEAGGQNWTASFPEEFRERRGYDMRPWLPAMTGHVVGSRELSERFLWDVRATAGEMIRDNYAKRFKQLIRPYGIKLSIEAYGQLCIDNLSYAGVGDMPISEFWAMGRGEFPTLPSGHRGNSTKAMASAAHVYGRPILGAEAFTSDRGWRDHPYLLKPMGDWAFCAGVNRMIFHLSAHQAYEDAIPGLTHRKWGEQFNRFNTWWDYTGPWIDYLTRCQYMLQRGLFVADACVLVGEGSPVTPAMMVSGLPAGYDCDFCSGEAVLQMTVRDGRLVLPSGMSYRYLVLPDTDRMTLPLARKLKELADAGARLVGGKRPVGTPGLTDYKRATPRSGRSPRTCGTPGRWRLGSRSPRSLGADKLAPDFAGEDLRYIHRRTADADLYFVANPEDEARDVDCTFRVGGKVPELWDPETGEIRDLPQFVSTGDGRTTVGLHFEPAQSWFVVFRKAGRAGGSTGEKNFSPYKMLRQIDGPWRVTFDPRWGGPQKPVTLSKLADWSKVTDPRIHYYSGTAVYRKKLALTSDDVAAGQGRLLLDLGQVDVMARVKLNGKVCGIAWRPPYRVDITSAARAGENELEIDVANLWINRLIGDEQLPLDGDWKDFETLSAWPKWFKEHKPRPSGRYTFTTCRHYKKDTPLVPSGLRGPVKLLSHRP